MGKEGEITLSCCPEGDRTVGRATGVCESRAEPDSNPCLGVPGRPFTPARLFQGAGPGRKGEAASGGCPGNATPTAGAAEGSRCLTAPGESAGSRPVLTCGRGGHDRGRSGRRGGRAARPGRGGPAAARPRAAPTAPRRPPPSPAPSASALPWRHRLPLPRRRRASPRPGPTRGSWEPRRPAAWRVRCSPPSRPAS